MHRPVGACDPRHTRPKASHSRPFQSTGCARRSRELTGKSYHGLRVTHRELFIFLFFHPASLYLAAFSSSSSSRLNPLLTFNQFHLFDTTEHLSSLWGCQTWKFLIFFLALYAFSSISYSSLLNHADARHARCLRFRYCDIFQFILTLVYAHALLKRTSSLWLAVIKCTELRSVP